MRLRVVVLVSIPLLGCASLIGANFDDASVREGDAADEEPLGLPDVHVSPDANDAGPPFDPSSLPNLSFWIDATYGVDLADGGPAVAVWHDRSGKGRDAVPAGGGTQAPTLVAASLNGKPVVHFTALHPDLLRSSWTGPDGPDLTLFLVARGYPQSALRFQTNAGAFPFVIFPLDLGAESFRLDVGTTYPDYTDLQTLFDGGATVLGATWRGDGIATTYRDGVIVEQKIVNPALPSGQTLYIGGIMPLTSSASYCDGDVAEAIVYASALDDAARRAVEKYLFEKWAIGP